MPFSRFLPKALSAAFIILMSLVSVYAQNGIRQYKKGMELKVEHRYSKSLRYFDKAIRKNPDNYKFYSSRASVRRVLGMYSDALNDAEKSVEMNENCLNGWYEQGVIMAIEGLRDEAIKRFDKCIELDGEFSSAYNGLGAIYYLEEDYDKALEYYQSALKLDEKNNANQFNVGQVLSKKGSPREALPYFNKALGILTDDQKSFFERGLALYKLGEMELAELDFGMSVNHNIKEDPWERTADDEAWYYKGMANHALKSDLKACSDFANAMELGHIKANEMYVHCGCEKVLSDHEKELEKKKESEASLEEKMAAEKLKVYPNPVVNFVNIRIPKPINSGARGTLIIVDAQGKEVKVMEDVSRSVVLDRTGLTSGNYFVKLRAADGTILSTERMVVQ